MDISAAPGRAVRARYSLGLQPIYSACWPKPYGYMMVLGLLLILCVMYLPNGLAPRMVDELLAIVQRIAAQGVTVLMVLMVLMVEQNVRKALQVARHGYVLERGRIVASGDASTLLQSDAVRQAYLGVA